MKKLGIQPTVLFLTLVLLGFISTPTLYGQSRQVSKILNKSDQTTDSDKAHMLHFDAQWLAESLGDETGLAEVNFRHALYYKSLGNLSLGDYFLELSMAHFQQQQYLFRVAAIQNAYDMQEIASYKEAPNYLPTPVLEKEIDIPEITLEEVPITVVEEEVVVTQERQLSLVQIIAGFVMIFSLLAVVYFRQQWKKTLDEAERE